jgi:hypothetical protein
MALPFTIATLDGAPAAIQEHYAKLPSGRYELQLDPSAEIVRLLYAHRIFLRRLEKAARPFPAFVAMIDAAKVEALSIKKGIR